MPSDSVETKLALDVAPASLCWAPTGVEMVADSSMATILVSCSLSRPAQILSPLLSELFNSGGVGNDGRQRRLEGGHARCCCCLSSRESSRRSSPEVIFDGSRSERVDDCLSSGRPQAASAFGSGFHPVRSGQLPHPGEQPAASLLLRLNDVQANNERGSLLGKEAERKTGFCGCRSHQKKILRFGCLVGSN